MDIVIEEEPEPSPSVEAVEVGDNLHAGHSGVPGEALVNVAALNASVLDLTNRGPDQEDQGHGRRRG